MEAQLRVLKSNLGRLCIRSRFHGQFSDAWSRGLETCKKKQKWELCIGHILVLFRNWILYWLNLEIEKYWKPLSWKSNLYFVSPSCFWRNWNVLHFRLELHDRNYWLRPSLTAWLLSSSPIKMSVGQNRTQGISFHTFLSASWEFWIWIVVLSYDRLSWMVLPT